MSTIGIGDQRETLPRANLSKHNYSTTNLVKADASVASTTNIGCGSEQGLSVSSTSKIGIYPIDIGLDTGGSGHPEAFMKIKVLDRTTNKAEIKIIKKVCQQEFDFFYNLNQDAKKITTPGSSKNTLLDTH